jgi:diaminobutyrate-2-oxoglutarate transaminase
VQTIARLESEVRSYCRMWPTVFDRAQGASLYDENGRRYIDFFAGAGALNYGHNDPKLRAALVDYLNDERIVHSLDMATVAKRDLLERFEEIVLLPRRYDYKLQFPGPTGTNAVEAALKLARKVTGRERVVGFTNAFHGMTLGSLSVTGTSMKRNGAGILLSNAATMPYADYFGDETDTIDYFTAFLEDSGSGLDLPAAVIVETVQAEGGLNVAPAEWLRRLQDLCHEHGILLIVDDIQVGCGRTGPFFSFEEYGIEPDIICLAKSLSAYGLPFALTLLKPGYDVWEPGEHNGTFRGHNLAFVAATAALETYWRDDGLSQSVLLKSQELTERLDGIINRHPELQGQRRGRGLVQGIACRDELAERIARTAFEHGLVLETSGPNSEVVKVLPPLTIGDSDLVRGLDLLEDAVAAVLVEGHVSSVAEGV